VLRNKLESALGFALEAAALAAAAYDDAVG
jgi:hypothetical protein